MRIFILAIALGAIPAIAAAQSAGTAAPAPLATTEAAPAVTPDDAARKVMREKFRIACGADVAKFCADTEKGKGLKRACLEQHQSEITSACKDALAERAAAKSKT